MTDTTVILYGAFLLLTYFLPTIVAINRHHRNRMAIVMLNFLLGWTLIGWVAAMVWACTADVAPQEPLPWERGK
jgi:hypothetical protein